MTEEEDYTENLSAGPASSIQAIDRGTVHRICSGQVVLNLATAVKELVENSLDAGATHIEVRLKEYGSEVVEVSDNGEGVEEKNFKGLTLKHHTSKLKDFSDLVSVDTFGFRGEALSSLCALSDVSITTCHKAASVGTRLEYDHHGNIQQQSPCPRQRGTTVCLQQLFSTLPVRHKEFQRNLKKEFSKMVQVLTAYCLICTGVRISCTNQIGKGKKNILVSTNGSPTIKDNVTSIFGAKQLQSILEFHQKSPSEDVCGEYNINNNQSEVFKIGGYVSRSEHGQGRSSTDRQFIFVNKRPCDLVKVARLVNDVYHINNRHQYPFLLLDIAINKECVDVNVTPDKRQIFMQNEKLLLATIKTSLLALFEPEANMYQINQPLSRLPSSLTASFSRSDKSPSQQKNSSLSHSFSTPSPAEFRSGYSSSQEQGTKISLTSALSSMKRSFSSSFCKESTDRTPEPDRSKQRRLDNFFTKSSPLETSSDRLSISNQSFTHTEIISTDSIDLIETNQSLQQENLSQNSTTDSGLSTGSGSQEETCESRILNEEGNEDCKQETKPLVHTITKQECETSNSYNDVECSEESLGNSIQLCSSPLSERLITKSKNFNSLEEIKNCVPEKTVTSESESPGNIKAPDSPIKLKNEACPQVTFTELDVKENVTRKTVALPFSLDKLKTRLKTEQKHDLRRRERSNMFHAKISPTDNQAAEDELRKVISKDSFSQMNILGQFNLGFIIARLKQDLFIIDQHATDEKYNFEMLQRHTVIQSQKLIQPQNLELTAVNENILMDNIEIFQKNGFDFIVDEEARPTQRVKLVSMPVSRNWVFGKDDIEELIFMLTDSPGMLCRPSRVRDMFASRACRKSIMVGTALNAGEMKKLVGHMGEIEHPWNCPHGRPTMRHLINLDMLADSETSSGPSSSRT